MAYPHAATTIVSTQLIVLGGDNIDVPAGTAITIHDEDGAFGTVSVNINGSLKFGSMVKSDYR